jgi:hypothetical protein
MNVMQNGRNGLGYNNTCYGSERRKDVTDMYV